MMSRIAFGFLVAALAAAAALSATTVENGYEVTRSQTVVPVPHGKLGRKTIDRETRTGNTPDTDGNSLSFTMTLGGFVNRCPVREEGSDPVKFVLTGDFEYSLIVDTVDTEVVPTERKHYAKRVNLQLKAVVNDDLSITEAEFNGDYTADIEGVRTGPVPIHTRFRIGEGGMPDMEALKDIAATSDLAAAALAWNASQVVLLARRDLYEPNACAELQFDPPSESRTVAPGETVEIRVKYRTRDGQKPIPKGTWDAAAVEGGRVAEATGQVRADGSFVVKYTARSSDPKEGDGMRAEALSAAGLAREQWKIRVGGDYELHFESNIVSREPVQSVQSTARGSARLTASTKPWRRKPDGKMYRLYDGNGSLQFSSAPGPERRACDPLISGSGTSQLQVLETWIQITPPSEQNGARVPGKADVQMTYWIPMGAGETETLQTNVNFRCVPGDVNPLPFWWSSYMSGRDPGGDVNFLTNWEYVGQDGIVARKVLTGNCGGMCSEERSVFTLRKVESQ